MNRHSRTFTLCPECMSCYSAKEETHINPHKERDVWPSRRRKVQGRNFPFLFAIVGLLASKGGQDIRYYTFLGL
uniref:C2H2-type domain-containing protein n=1 Tax=Steinernema glaseri TaxID=37863 RepID=A0A1I7Z9C6_9BILA